MVVVVGAGGCGIAEHAERVERYLGREAVADLGRGPAENRYTLFRPRKRQLECSAGGNLVRGGVLGERLDVRSFAQLEGTPDDGLASSSTAGPEQAANNMEGGQGTHICASKLHATFALRQLCDVPYGNWRGR